MKRMHYNISQRVFGLLVVISVLAGPNIFGQTTNPPPIQLQFSKMTDSASLISWEAETGAVYQVESADMLDQTNLHGLIWVVRETDWPSLGCQTKWMDVGDTAWIPRIFHPVFQNHRFYRVTRTGMATLPASSIALQLSQTNAALPSGTNSVQGDLDISVTLTPADTNQTLSSVDIFVDGQRLYSIPSTNFMVSINTTEWPNGPHEIYAVATLTDGGETIPGSDDEVATNAANFSIGISPISVCVFSNYISRFFVAVPYFDPLTGQAQEITAAFPEDTYWRLTVLNYQYTPVHQFTGQSSTLYAAWNGNNQSDESIPYGYYDYYIEARPSRYGPLANYSFTGGQGNNMMFSQTTTPLYGAQLRASFYQQVPAAMEFSATNTAVREVLSIPSLNPTNNAVGGTNINNGPPMPSMAARQALGDAWYPTSAKMAMEAGLSDYYIPAPPMPPLRTNINGLWKTIAWEEVYGTQPLIKVNISPMAGRRKLQGASRMAQANSNDDPPLDNWADTVYTTITPVRIPGNLFKGYAGTVGIGFQGNHPKFSVQRPSGNVISPTSPAYGPLSTVAALTRSFSINMGLGGWRTSFYLGNNNLRRQHLIPFEGYPGRFATRADFGLLAGHMTATANNSWLTCTHSYFPLYNSDIDPTAIDWLPLPQMNFGGTPGSTLKWMALYGCNSLRVQDFNDMWSKFLLPMPYNLRLLLGSEDGVFIAPSFGFRLAGNLHGFTNNGTPMTIANAWYAAAQYVDIEMSKSWRFKFIMNTRTMTVGYRSTTMGGSWNTLNDSIWSYGGNISYDWFDESIDQLQVFPPQ
ncbi:MAG: hypothetical protein WCO56_26240 [Verrucomicrobiota bacterium]